MSETQTEYQKSRQSGITAEMIKEHAIESRQQLAEVIATMTVGIMRNHGLTLRPARKNELEKIMAAFIAKTPELMQQIEEQLRASIVRPLPPAA